MGFGAARGEGRQLRVSPGRGFSAMGTGRWHGGHGEVARRARARRGKGPAALCQGLMPCRSSGEGVAAG